MKPLTIFQKSALAQVAHPKHLESLVHDEHPPVRWRVARYGTDQHRDQLVHDKDSNVRWRVAKHGNENHARALLKDKNDLVSQAAKNRLKDLKRK